MFLEQSSDAVYQALLPHGIIVRSLTSFGLPNAIRVSVGASLVVPYAQYVDPVDLLALLRERGFESWALTPADDAVDIRSLRSSEPRRIALWLGTEGAGLTAQVLTAAERRVQIAIEPDFDSLNVAATAGIALHELRR